MPAREWARAAPKVSKGRDTHFFMGQPDSAAEHPPVPSRSAPVPPEDAPDPAPGRLFRGHYAEYIAHSESRRDTFLLTAVTMTGAQASADLTHMLVLKTEQPVKNQGGTPWRTDTRGRDSPTFSRPLSASQKAEDGAGCRRIELVGAMCRHYWVA